MPARSAAQYRMARATLGGADTGMPRDVAQEMVDATPHPGKLPEKAPKAIRRLKKHLTRKR